MDGMSPRVPIDRATDGRLPPPGTVTTCGMGRFNMMSLIRVSCTASFAKVWLAGGRKPLWVPVLHDARLTHALRITCAARRPFSTRFAQH
eukprot:6679049-Alexandrium_andersonii.AAC.1